MKHFELWFLKFFSFLCGCLFCFYLQSYFGVSAVIAASLTGLLGSFIPDNKRISSFHIHATIYMGAFVAMGSLTVDAGPMQLVLVSLLGSTIYFLATPYFRGLGGKLGLIAFVSSIIGFIVRGWL